MISVGRLLNKKPMLLCSNGFFYALLSQTSFGFGVHKKSQTLCVRLFIGRDGEIRTHDPLHPMQVRYRAALHPDKMRLNGSKHGNGSLTQNYLFFRKFTTLLKFLNQTIYTVSINFSIIIINLIYFLKCSHMLLMTI